MKECPLCLACLDDAPELCPSDRSALEKAFAGTPVVDGKYQLERRLGRGGMGVVYRARHLGLERTFALKLIRSAAQASPDFPERFRTEARALGRLKHPHIVEVTDYGVDPRDGGLPYLVMEYLEGDTLQQLCHDAGGLDVARALPLLGSIAAAIDHAHGQGVLHRDLKPANVVVCDRNAARPKILDFGLARLTDPLPDLSLDEDYAARSQQSPEPPPAPPAPETSLPPPFQETAWISSGPTPQRVTSQRRHTERGTLAGTPAYMAPELVRSEEASEASDVYAFGVLAYESLVGALPFDGTPREILKAQLEEEPKAPSSRRVALPPELDAPLLAALHKDRALRPKTASDVVRGLRTAWLQSERRRWRERERPRRLRLTALLVPAIALMAALLGRLPPVAAVERLSIDARFAVRPPSLPDPRLLVLSVDEASLAAEPALLAERADEFGRGLARVFGAGAKGVAIDFLLPERWSRSEPFSRLVLGHADSLTLAVFSTPDGGIIGTECLAGLTSAALGLRAAELFGFANLDEDPDGVVRRGRGWYADRDGARRDTWAARAARSLSGVRGLPEAAERFWIDHSIDWRHIPTLSWKDVDQRLEQDPASFDGRLVLVGGAFAASGDDHRVPARSGAPRSVKGVVLQALSVSTLLSGQPLHEASALASAAATTAACTLILWTALWARGALAALAVAAGLSLAFSLAGFLAFRSAGLLLPLAAPLVVVALTLAAGLLLRSRLPPFPSREA